MNFTLKNLSDLKKTRRQNFLSSAQRISLLERLSENIIANRAHVNEAIKADSGKPFEETDITEIYPVLSEIRFAVSNLSKWMSAEKISRKLSHYNSNTRILFQPKGVVLIIAPWNYPFNLVMGPLVSAIAAGNSVILKPSEFTPQITKIIEKIIAETFNNNEVQVITGESETAAKLVSMPFNHIFFTGSPETGKKVMRAAAENLVPVTLELGGKSPFIIDETSNLKKAVSRLLWAKSINCGQTCIAPDYVLIHKNVFQETTDLLKKEAEKQFSEGFEKSYSRIINSKHFDRIEALLNDAHHKGAELIFGGVPDVNLKKELLFPPVILTEMSDEMRIMQEEIFGPLLPVMAVDTINDAVDYIQERPEPLATYLFSGKNSAVEYFRKYVATGALVVNDTLSQYTYPGLPFGGVGNSGMGKAHGKAGFLEFSNQISELKTGNGPVASDFIKPPYDKKTRLLIETALKHF